ncbi:transcriptional regulator, LacI family [Novosphingobium aromaticivorans DSM 12444]|uniref:Transcriptional regulator, LacI family n=2 Tax=Novosphingobium aromaticivorans TaxID=48935 RepID=Q2G7K5_NOVAD|nr:transcriptional regulator, LacI family [Novosphingobium aromaticivorans DSM 12444]SCY58094.1 transcriptional regulator, LacI family [Novosphingobium aromaticivorans]
MGEMNIASTSRGNAHATMEDVAKLAGVSLKSVSRVINAEPHVSAKLRAKVEAAIAELNYVPDTAARSLAGSRAFIVGLLFDNPSPNYTMNIQKGVYETCRDQQHHLRIDNIDSTVPAEKFEAQLAAMVRNSRCDGFVLTPPLTDNVVLLDFLDRSGIRYVRIAPDIQPDRSPGVCIDDAAAAAAAARHLWELGHRRFAVVRGPASHGAAGRRRQGFIDELHRLGAENPIIEAEGNFSFESGIAAGAKVLAATPRPTAIFAANDDSAAGVMVACSQAGLKVPNDVSVCGFDDSWVAKSVWPYLTTVYQPIEEMGRAAAALLLRRDEPDNVLHELDFSLVVRASTAPPPQ